jgi:glycine hydroxymethyltransferase
MSNIQKLIKAEEIRQKDTLMMIPSENYTYPEVREAVGSWLMHKYSEGYAGRRYYQGNGIVDDIERIAVERTKKLFNVPHANVQPYSGSPANSAVYMALAEPGSKIMGMELKVGGHLTHGHPDITFSGKYYRTVQFGVGKNGRLNYDEILKIAKKEKPKVMLIGTTAYPLAFNWKKFSEIADSVGAWLVADISHVVGLVIAGVYPSPVNYAHVITSTTHKSLRGPRGAIILVTNKGLKKDKELATKIDRAVFPGMQGGPHNNTTAGIAIALEKAGTKNFESYGKKIVSNAKVLASELKKSGLKLYADGTECHLIVVDLIPKKLSGNVVAEGLEVAGIVVNRNSVPNDPMPPFYPSGIRLGTPALTARGMGEAEMKKIAKWIVGVIDHVSEHKLPNEPEKRSGFMKEYKSHIVYDQYLLDINKKVKELCKKFPA